LRKNRQPILHRLPIVYSVPLGGPVLFGTDVGFTTAYDTSLEYELMHRALSEREVLASLTTNPPCISRLRKRAGRRLDLTPISSSSTATR
jgi:hypothetical protein